MRTALAGLDGSSPRHQPERTHSIGVRGQIERSQNIRRGAGLRLRSGSAGVRDHDLDVVAIGSPLLDVIAVATYEQLDQVGLAQRDEGPHAQSSDRMWNVVGLAC